MSKLFFQVKYEQPRLAISHARWLRLSYQWIPSWDAVTKLGHPSKCQTRFCKNSIEDLTHGFCLDMSDRHCHLGT